GFDLLEEIGLDRLGDRLTELTVELLGALLALRHTNGAPLVRVYGPTNPRRRGATVALNVLDRAGGVALYEQVEDRAREAGTALRGGCFCNPGAAEAAFAFDAAATRRCFDALGSDFSIPALRACLAPGAAVGAVRLSLGFATTDEDLTRTIALLASFGA